VYSFYKDRSVISYFTENKYFHEYTEFQVFMPARKKKGERSVPLSATIKPEQEKWIEEKIRDGTFYNRSHIVQAAINLLQKSEKI